MELKTYSDLMLRDSFIARYRYLKLPGVVGESTFGFERYLNQTLYQSRYWRKLRDEIIVRDHGCDLGIEDYELHGSIIVHHLNPITLDDIELGRKCVFDPENLICTGHNTHRAIHYGDETMLPQPLILRQRHDTCPWR